LISYRAKIEKKKQQQQLQQQPTKPKTEKSRIFNSSDEDDDDLFDGAKNDENLKNVQSTKTLVGELSTKIVDKKSRGVESSSSSDDSEKSEDRNAETSKTSNPMPPSTFLGELSSRIVAKSKVVSQNGTLSSFSSQEVKVAATEPAAKPVVLSTQKPDLKEGLQNPAKPASAPKKEKSIFDTGSSSSSENEVKEALFKKPEPVPLLEKPDPVPTFKKPDPVPAKTEPAQQPQQPAKSKDAKSLFGSDSDSDDLFSSSRLVKPKILAPKKEEPKILAPKKEEKKKIGLFSSDDEDLGLPAASKVSKSQTVDSKSALKEVVNQNVMKSSELAKVNQIEPKEIKNATAEVVVKQIAEPKKTKSLFEDSDSSSDDDMDILFKKASTTNKPSPDVAKAKAKNLFSESSEEEDPIFGVPKKSETPNSVAEKSNSLPKEKASKTKSEEMEKAKIVETKKMEFLAKAAIIKLPSSSEQKSNENVENKTLAENDESSSDIKVDKKVDEKADKNADEVDDDEADGNVMSMKKDLKFKDILTAKLAKGPKVVGKQRKTSNSKDENSLKSQEQKLNPEDQQPVKQQQQQQQQQKQQQKPIDKVEPEKKKSELPAPVQKVEKIVAEKQTPKSQISNVEKVETSPDLESVSVNTLESLTKSRAKLPNNRRAPTRKGLKAMSQSGHDQADSSVKPVDLVKPVDHFKPLDLVKPVVHVKPVDQVEPTDLVKPEDHLKPGGQVKPGDNVKPVDHVKPDDPDSKPKQVNPLVQLSPEGSVVVQSEIPKSAAPLQDVHSTKKVSEKSIEIKTEAVTTQEPKTDLIKAVSEPVKMASSKSANSLRNEVESKPTIKTPETNSSSSLKPVSKTDNLPTETTLPTNVASSSGKSVESSDEDLFGPPPMPEVIKSNRDPLFGSQSSDDDDDLFAAKNVSKIPSKTSRGIFEDGTDDDDDLFASH
jgi:hypothetical protein